MVGKDICLRVLLISSARDDQQQTERGESALLLAISRDHLQCVEVLLENGQMPNSQTTIERLHSTKVKLMKVMPVTVHLMSYSGFTKEENVKLWTQGGACERNSPRLVAVLLNHGVGVNTHCIQGWTPLQEAVCANNVEICEMLMKAGAKHNLTNTYGISPLFTAAQAGQLATLRLLVKHGADINSQAPDGATALYEAAKNGHEEIIELLVSQKADANKPGKNGLLPLHIAAQRGNDTIVSMLLTVTSKVRVLRAGISPLHLAAERNRNDVLEVLIEAGFDVNAQLSRERSKLYEDHRSTVLYFAVINNNTDAVRMLLEAGANPNLDVFKPLMVAARMGCIQIITLLVEHGADINADIPTHPTTFPAVYIFSMKYLSMFKYLLDNGGHARSCFDCVYGSQPHPPIKTNRSERGDLQALPVPQGTTGVQTDGTPEQLPRLECDQRQSRLQILQLVGHRHLKKLPLPGGLIRFLIHDEGLADEC
ncbi:Ankyrin repeat and SOCS box protein 2 [Collichthys lucidus]|uniref:Ankyrin repeat and SOCS box protein 2 n=1 Tax=Collichthys lucidus TaxID=240159 RepID=A0A4U5TUQ6_COLLU|nr:Ankyrin repeat and SOCS box protein 2 [Collichthys lucidus]